MSKPLRIRSGTEEELVRDFGPDRLLIGFPVEPSDEAEADEQSDEDVAVDRDDD